MARKQPWDSRAISADPRARAALADFKAKLEKFSSSAHELLVAWDGLDPDLSAAMAENYPFHKDFMELALDISGWKNTVRKMRS